MKRRLVLFVGTEQELSHSHSVLFYTSYIPKIVQR